MALLSLVCLKNRLYLYSILLNYQMNVYIVRDEAQKYFIYVWQKNCHFNAHYSEAEH